MCMYACGNWIGQPIPYIVHTQFLYTRWFKENSQVHHSSSTFTFVKGYIFLTKHIWLSHLPIRLLDKPLLHNDWHKFWICNRRHVMLLSAIGETFDHENTICFIGRNAITGIRQRLVVYSTWSQTFTGCAMSLCLIIDNRMSFYCLWFNPLRLYLL